MFRSFREKTLNTKGHNQNQNERMWKKKCMFSDTFFFQPYLTYVMFKLGKNTI